jgi:hypothetical protein
LRLAKKVGVAVNVILGKRWKSVRRILAVENNGLERLAMICDVKPITNLQAVALDRKRFVGECVANH